MNTQRSQVSAFAIALLMAGLVIGVWLCVPPCYAPAPPYNETDAKVFDPDDLPWDNETDIIILPPPLPPFFRYFTITPTEIMLGEDLAISFVIENPNNQTITRMSTTRIGDFFTQIIEIRLEAYESKHIYYRIIPHVAGEYDVWIDGMTGTFRVISTEIIIIDPLEELNLRIDYLDTNLQDLTEEFFILQTAYGEHLGLYNVIIEDLYSKSNEVNEQFLNLENKISRLQNTILWVGIGAAIIVILSAAILIRKGAIGMGGEQEVEKDE